MQYCTVMYLKVQFILIVLMIYLLYDFLYLSYRIYLSTRITHFSVKIKEVMEWIGIKTDNDLNMFGLFFLFFRVLMN